MEKLVYGVDGKPKFKELLVFALQQVLAIMAATIAVPAIIGLPIATAPAILGAGLGTITYLLFTKFKSPVCISSSFAFLSSLGVALSFGYCGIIIGGILAGLVYVAIAVVLHFTGAGWVNKLMPPVIIGPTVAIIGLSLAGNAMGDIVKANGATLNGSYNLIALLCGLITFFGVVFFSVQNKWKGGRLIPFVLGICAGYAAASIFSIFGYAFDCDYLKIMNWQPLVDNFKNITFTSFFDVPQFALIGAIKELVNGEVSAEVLAANASAVPLIHDGAFDWAGLGSIALAFIPVALVVFAEHIADHKNLGSIIGADLVGEDPGLKRTLLGDGVGSMVGTVFGICPNTTYGESVGCVAITKNASTRTIFAAAIMCIVISFFKPAMVLLETIPSCAMGGVCLTLYGFIAVSGLKMFKDIDLGESKNLFTVSAILIAGIGGLSIQIPYAIEAGVVSKTIQITSVATALILGIATYAVCNAIEGKKAASANEDKGE